MKYIATTPTMAPYLEQYVRYHGGQLTDGSINLSIFPQVENMIRRNLVYFTSREKALAKWPDMMRDCTPHIGVESIRHTHRRQDTETSIWVLGPSGANEVVEYLQALFDYALITDWTETMAEYAKNTYVVPIKATFVNSFCERHGISSDEKEFRSVLKRMNRLLDKVDAVKNNRSLLCADIEA